MLFFGFLLVGLLVAAVLHPFKHCLASGRNLEWFGCWAFLWWGMLPLLIWQAYTWSMFKSSYRWNHLANAQEMADERKKFLISSLAMLAVIFMGVGGYWFSKR